MQSATPAQISTFDNDTIYFIGSTQEIYKGSQQYGGNTSDIISQFSQIWNELSILDQRIDGAIETYTGATVPSVGPTPNWPYTDWYDTTTSPVIDDRANHVGDLYYVVNSESEQDGYCYRFYYDNTTNTYSWVLIKDSDVTAALQKADEAADAADAAAGSASAAAASALAAQGSARQAELDAERAADAADAAEDDADRARIAANSAVTDAGRAAEAAEAAADSAAEAATAAGVAEGHAAAAAVSAGNAAHDATEANKYANAALNQLGVVQDVAGVLTWASEHGTYTVTADTTIQEGKTYFIYDSQNDTYTPVITPQENPHTAGYYELSVDEAMNDYIMSHLAVTDQGLWVLPNGINTSAANDIYLRTEDTEVQQGKNYYTYDEQTKQYTLVSNPQTSQIENYYEVFVPPAGESEKDWRARLGKDYKMLLSNSGASIYDGQGVLVVQYGSSITFDLTRGFIIGDASNQGNGSYIAFSPSNGVVIGGNVIIGGSQSSLSDVIIDTVIEYAKNTSPTTAPASDSQDWSEDSPTRETGKYIWQRIGKVDATGTIHYSTPVCISGADGTPGTPGGSGYNTATVYLYQRSATTPTKQSNNLTYTFSSHTLSGTLNNGWVKTIAETSGDNPLWVIAATATSTEGEDTILGTEWSSPAKMSENGTDGQPGAPGLNQATIYLYQRAENQPSPPATSCTYTFADGTISETLGNWTRTIPASDSNHYPCWVTSAVAIASTATDTIDTNEWATVTKLVEDGEDGAPGTVGANGYNTATIYLYQRNSGTPNKPTGDPLTYTFSTKTLSGTINNGWKTSLTAVGDSTDPIWIIAATATSNTATDEIESTDWSTPIKLAQNGASAYSYDLTASPSAIVKNGSTLTPSSVTFSATRTEGQGTPQSFSGYLVAEYYNGTSWQSGATTTGSSYTYSSIPSTAKQIRCTLYTAQNGTQLDVQTVPIVTDGTDGTSYHVHIRYADTATPQDNQMDNQPTGHSYIGVYTGVSETPPTTANSYIWTKYIGTDGVTPVITHRYDDTTHETVILVNGTELSRIKDGENGEDAYTVMLTNEAHVFPAGVSAATIGATTSTEVIAYKGATAVTPSIGTINTGVTGLTPTISGSTITFTVTSAFETKDGIITIPITVDGKTFNLKFSWSLALEGQDGLNQATIYLYQRAASAPSKPGVNYYYRFEDGKLCTQTDNTLTPISYPASNGWYREIPASDGNPCWVTSAVAISTSASDVIESTEWAAITKMVSDGQQGAQGPTGPQGATGPEANVEVYPSAIDWGAGTATLSVAVRVNGVAVNVNNITNYKWTKGTSSALISEGASASTLSLSNSGTNKLDTTYHCTVTWTQNSESITQTGDIDFKSQGGLNSYAALQYATNTTVSAMSTAIEQTAANVLIKATKSTATAEEIAAGAQTVIQSLINVAPEGVVIAADKVNIEGAAIFTSGGAYDTSTTIVDSETQWYSSTSATTKSGGSWSTSPPSVDAGRYIWQRELVTYANGDTDFKPSSDGVCIQGQTNLSNYATTSTVNTANYRSQRIYQRTIASANAPGKLETWLASDTTNDGYGNWTLTIPQLTNNNTKYPKLYTAVQTQTVAQYNANPNTLCSCSDVKLDDSMTVIDGGNIITGSVEANKITTGQLRSQNYVVGTGPYSNTGTEFDLNNGNLKTPSFGVLNTTIDGYTAGVYINDDFVARSGKIGWGTSGNDANYWEIKTWPIQNSNSSEPYTTGMTAAGESFINVGKLILESRSDYDNSASLHTGWITKGNNTYTRNYLQDTSNHYWDYGLQAPILDPSTANYTAGVDDNFLYIKKTYSTTIPSTETASSDNWIYQFKVDKNGNLTAQDINAIGTIKINGQPINAMTWDKKVTFQATGGATAGTVFDGSADVIVNYSTVGAASSGHTHNISLATDTGNSTVTLASDGKYKLTAGGNSIIFTMPTIKNGTVTSITAGAGLSGGTITTSGTIAHSNSVTAQTTQAVYPIKIDAQGHISAYGSAVTILTLGTTASTAAKGNHTHTASLASDTGTSAITLDSGGKYKLTAGGSSVIFTMPTSTANTGTVTSISLAGSNGISIDNTAAITTSGTRTISHTNSVTAKTAAVQSAKTLDWGGTFTLYEEKYDAQGHITGVASYNMTMPANPNTDTHHTAALITASSASGTNQVSAATTSPYLNLVENGSVRSTTRLTGSGTVSVASSADGKTITITGTAHPTSLKNPNALNINVYSGTSTASTINYDGSIANQSINVASNNAITGISASTTGGVTTFTLARANGDNSTTFDVSITGAITTGAKKLTDANGTDIAAGSLSIPVYFANGLPSAITSIATSLLTGLNLNGSAISTINSPSWYAPTSAGTSGQLLQSSGGVPSWVNTSSITVGTATNATQFSSNATVTLTGDTTGTSTGSKKSWSVPTKTQYITSLGRATSADYLTPSYLSKIHFCLASSSMTTHKPPAGDGYITTYHWDNTGWAAQFYIRHSKDDPSPMVRGAVSTNDTSDWGEWKYILTEVNYNNYTVKKDGTGASGSWGISITGNAATATSATSATSATKATNDSDGNAINTTYVKKSGDNVVTGKLSKAGVSTNWNKGRDNALIRTSSLNGYSPLWSAKTNNGSWDIGTYDNNSYTDDLIFTYITDTDYSGQNKTTAQIKFLENGHIVAALDGNASTASSVVWSGITSKPDQATRWPYWTEIQADSSHLLTEGTSNLTDHSEILTSYASDNGFADTNAPGRVYRRDAVCMYNYINTKLSNAGTYVKKVGDTMTGGLQAPNFNVNGHCNLQYDTTTESLIFVFS